ncbi:MAG: ABC transporter permease [Butyrivibrio sp.]|nr:ABC transporter permease [Acetatifactor muris]MCM1560667.1 ABC transporter permease [Butyrivibrio sp.]
MLIRKLFRTARRYKAQFISMVIMVAIGMGVFLGFNIEWKSIEEDTGSFFEQTRYADFRLYSETGFTKEEVQAIREISGVEAATRFLSVNAAAGDGNKSVALMVSEDYNVSTMLVTAGAEYDRASDGIWLSDQFAEKNDIALGDRLVLHYSGLELAGEVVGLCKSGEMMICTADENQLMPDYENFGFAYLSPDKLEKAFGMGFYPQINIISDMDKQELEEAVREKLGRTILITDKEAHVSYAGALSETEEGKTMGSILPVLFLAIGILTMVTTMHRIAANEKTQIGTLKALGFKDRRILRHYTSYGFVIGLIGTGLGVFLGYGLAAVIINPEGMMGTYFDLPDWSLAMPGFCIPVMAGTVGLLTLISFLSVRKMLAGTAADALRPYTPKAMRKSVFERLALWEKLPFGTKWNIRDVLRHKSRSAMTLFGVIGCMLLLVGGMGMKDTMQGFMALLDDGISNYATKINLSDTASNGEAEELARRVNGDWVASSGISFQGETVVLEVYGAENDLIRFVDEDNEYVELTDDGAYVCLRLGDDVKVGDTIEISPYGSEEVYRVKVAGVLRSVLTENIVMTDGYAESVGIPYHISSIYTDRRSETIEDSALIAGKQDKQTIMDSYDSFMDIMNIMVLMLVLGAVILGLVVLYNLGVMSYVERSRELATLKVLGFRDRHIGRLLISQNVWLTALGVIIGLPAGVATLQALITALATEYELKLCLGPLTYCTSILVTFGTSLVVGRMVARKNREIDMTEALKGAE